MYLLDPDVVKNLATQNITTTSITLSWEKPVGNVSSYFIQILGDPAINTTVTTTYDIIEGLIPGNYYTLLVNALVDNSFVNGAISEIFQYTSKSLLLYRLW